MRTSFKVHFESVNVLLIILFVPASALTITKWAGAGPVSRCICVTLVSFDLIIVDHSDLYNWLKYNKLTKLLNGLFYPPSYLA